MYGLLFGLAALGIQPERVYSVTVTNAGMVPVTINSVRAHVKGTEGQILLVGWRLQTPAPLPQKLGQGEMWTGLFGMVDFLKAVNDAAKSSGPPWKVTILVKDAADRDHAAPTMKVGVHP
jgi:hypothetical protein